MSDETKDLVRLEPKTLLKPVVSLKEIQETQNEVEQLITGGLKTGVDFGKIPGTPKPTLLKPGAEKILRWFNCYAEYKILSEDHDSDKINTYEGDVWEWDDVQRKKIKTGKREKQESAVLS